MCHDWLRVRSINDVSDVNSVSLESGVGFVAGGRNSYSASTQVRDIHRVTFWESRKFGLSVTAISPSLSELTNPVLIMLRKSMSL